MVVQPNGSVFLYRLKDEAYRQKFNLNIRNEQGVRVFRKVVGGVEVCGVFRVAGFEAAKKEDHPGKFGTEFVKMVKMVEQET